MHEDAFVWTFLPFNLNFDRTHTIIDRKLSVYRTLIRALMYMYMYMYIHDCTYNVFHFIHVDNGLTWHSPKRQSLVSLPLHSPLQPLASEKAECINTHKKSLKATSHT